MLDGTRVYRNGHQSDLYDLLRFDSANESLLDGIMAIDKIEAILQLVATACPGHVVSSRFNDLIFQREGNTEELNVSNLSS